ncbi:MAG: hypothetical protein AAF525_20630 [Pseudomonadota bacterium]
MTVLRRTSAHIVTLTLVLACTGCELWRQTPDNALLLKSISQEWYCYSDNAGDSWDCGLEEKEPTILAASRDPGESASNRFILSQSDLSYAVQLLGHWDREQIANYAASVGLKAPYIEVRIPDEELDWYVLLLGVYPDEKSASSSMERWIDEVKPDIAPSLIELAPLQQAIRAAGS